MSDIDVTASMADRGRDLRIQGQIIPPPGTTVGNVLTATAAGSSWQAGGGGSLTTVSSYLGANVALTANIYSDIVSVALTAGTWLLIGSVIVLRTGAAGEFTAKVWDGTTVASSTTITNSSAGVGETGSLAAIVVVAAPTTYKISVAPVSINSSVTQTPAANNAGCAGTASYLLGVKIA